MHLWKKIQTMKELNIPYPHLAQSPTPGVAKKKDPIINQNPLIKSGLNADGVPSPSTPIIPQLMLLLMTAAPSAVRSGAVPSGVALVARGAPAPPR